MLIQRKLNRLLLPVIVMLLAVGTARAEMIDLVEIDNPDNAADTRYATPGYGAVDYVYQIGKYEVTNAQWREFLNAKAALGDSHGLYSERMDSTYGGIARAGSGTVEDPWVYYAKGNDSNWDNRPVNYVSFWDAARFCNWLHNGRGDGDTESGAYINIGDQDTFARQPDAQWWIPSQDEWYKAAYHKNNGATGNYWDYPTGANAVPSNKLLASDPGNNANFYDYGDTIGSPYYVTEVGAFKNSASPYGTFDQGGNVWEWNETAAKASDDPDDVLSLRTLRGGGSYNYTSGNMRASASTADDPTIESRGAGFRVASVAVIPEPGAISLLLGGAVVGLIGWRRRT
ncbi:MAG: formylglycine-generating enzyme family protein [Pirellulaceae bacterium]|nr:formylglycine-generating enzyme family protein [Pirellulaceae bacterium]